MISNTILFVGAMAILAVLFIIVSLTLFEKGERVFKSLSIRGWNYYKSMAIYCVPISKSEYYEALKKEAEERLKEKKLKDKLRNE